MSLTKDQIKTALENTTGSNPNLFVSTHACAPDFLPEYFEKYYSVKSVEDIENTYTATVPDNTIVITFTPDNHYGVSDDEDEQLFMKKLSDPTWVNNKRWEHTQNAKLYLPGDKVYNQLVNFETEASYYDIFTLDGKIYKAVNKSFRSFGYPSKFLLEEAEEVFPDRRRSSRINPKSWRSRNAKDAIKFKSIPLQKLIDKLASPVNYPFTRRTTEKNKIRILYIFACNPTTNVDRDLDSYASAKMPLSTIINTIEDLRELYSYEGHDRFAKYFGQKRLRRFPSEEVTPDSDSDSESKSDKIRFRVRDSLYSGQVDKDKLASERSRMIGMYAEKYGITESGGSCFTPCKKSMCGKIFCSKWGTCINEKGETEKCLEPESEKAGKRKTKKKHSKKKKQSAKKKRSAKKKHSAKKNKKQSAKKR